MALYPCTNAQCPEKKKNPNNQHKTPRCPYTKRVSKVNTATERFGLLPPNPTSHKHGDPFTRITEALLDKDRDRNSALVGVEDLNIEDIEVGDRKATHVMVEAYYLLGGHDYVRDKHVKRGYYLTARPIALNNDESFESAVDSSNTVLLKESVGNPRWEKVSAYARITPTLIKSLVSQMPQYREKPDPEQMFFDFESLD